MKRAYLLAFSDGLGTREQIKECLNTMPSVLTWRYDMTNAFYLISEESADVISNELRERIKSNGRFIVTEISENRQGWLTEASWYLIRYKQHQPEKK